MYLPLKGVIKGIVIISELPSNWFGIITSNQLHTLWFEERESISIKGKVYRNLNFYIPIQTPITFEKIKQAFLNLELSRLEIAQQQRLSNFFIIFKIRAEFHIRNKCYKISNLLYLCEHSNNNNLWSFYQNPSMEGSLVVTNYHISIIFDRI